MCEMVTHVVLGRDWILVFQPKPPVTLTPVNKNRWSSVTSLVGLFLLVNYTLVSQITRVIRLFPLQTSARRFCYTCVISGEE